MVHQKPVFEVLYSIQGALGEKNQKVFAKASMALGKVWGKSAPKAETPDALMEKVAEYLHEDLNLCKSVTLEKQGQDFVLKNRGLLHLPWQDG